MRSVDRKVTRVDVVALNDHLKYFGLVHRTLLHKVNDLVLDCDGVVHVVVELHLDLVLELTILFKELLIIDWVREVLVILGEQTHLTIVDPGVVFITHWVLGPHTAVLATSQQVQLVQLLV